MKFSHIHHVAIICSDYSQSKDFYTRILGFEIIHETYRAERQSYKLDLRIDNNSQIELFSFPDAPKRPSYPEAQGLRHLAFSVDNIEKAIDHLNSFDIETEPIRIDEITGKRFTFFSDPDGLPLELYEV
ncbi:glyoxylase I family protein [Dysgonomonas alginatilytica]|uniref:Glyoxylase I family protein n=1 Tax=Dysgonomonas alginatilytica TaxID=1605892 RepID=A0A2V3PTY6_9BACT|nr:VOC family protein [Dysgonomonas alginatilytica]PXV69170.1 glyoxylase I family protein [Dysgonomonas alginatilytica]